MKSHSRIPEKYFFVTKLMLSTPTYHIWCRYIITATCLAYPRFLLLDTDHGLLTPRISASVCNTATLAFNKYTHVIITGFLVVQRRNKALCFLLHISLKLTLVAARLIENITKNNENSALCTELYVWVFYVHHFVPNTVKC
jgi:hypothetical protein